MINWAPSIRSDISILLIVSHINEIIEHGILPELLSRRVSSLLEAHVSKFGWRPRASSSSFSIDGILVWIGLHITHLSRWPLLSRSATRILNR